MKDEWFKYYTKKSLCLGFYGSESFKNKSLNFAFNYGVINESDPNIIYETNNIAIVKTKTWRLKRALLREGRVIGIRKMVQEEKDLDNFSVQCEVEKYAEDYKERIFNSIVLEEFRL